ncbi:MAG: LysR family transcriptional regulator [Candidatus Latescibacteria bacterium]|nr:LysR family transcriptional regulator [Candidatus Latescibacterota bacterium]
MDFYQLRSFCEIARQGSFTRAADKLFLTQPALSLQVKALEEELGEALFERAPNRLRLTMAGELLYGHAQAVLARLEVARAEINALQQQLRGRLVLATSDTNCTYVLPGVLQAFRGEHPQVEIEIRNKMSPEVARLVLDHEVDLGLATLPVRHRDLISEELFARQDVAICPPGHPLAAKKKVRLQEVAAYPLLALEQGSTSRRLLEEACRQEQVELRTAMDLGSIEVLKRFVEIGMGVALVPQVAVAAEVEAGRLRAVEVRGLPRRAIGLVEHRGRRRSPMAAAFVELLKERVVGRRL